MSRESIYENGGFFGVTRGYGESGIWNLKAALSGISSALFTFTTATFTPGSSTGRDGPSLIQARAGLTGPEAETWKNNTEYFNTTNGIQLWTVPQDGTYRIEARGATGASSNSGTGGRGAKIRLDISLTQGEPIRMLVGQPGLRNAQHGGGGGGTFVLRNSSGTADADIIVIAGGGGGRRQAASGNGIDGNYGQISGTSGTNLQFGLRNGTNSSASASGVSINSSGGSGFTPSGGATLRQGGHSANSGFGDGGGGLLGNGFEDGRGPSDGGGRSFSNGGIGGNGSGANGGFGGGGSGQGGNGGGGGGGFTGGHGGFTAGGGGSFVNSSGENIVYSVDSNFGPAGTNLTSSVYAGYVEIIKL